MRPLCCLITPLVLASGCAPEAKPRPPPTDAFYFPTGIAHAPFGGTDAGLLIVASSNFDKRYDFGSLTSVNLDLLPTLPPLGADGGLVQITDLRLTGSDQVEIQSL